MIAQINALSIFIPRLHDGVPFGFGVPAHGFLLNSEQSFGLILDFELGPTLPRHQTQHTHTSQPFIRSAFMPVTF
jgi:hypothetical protein